MKFYCTALLCAGLLLGVVAPRYANASVAAARISVPVLTGTPSLGGRIDASWETAASISLATDFTYRRPAVELTQVQVAQDRDGLDIAFTVVQQETLTAVQVTDGSSVLNDDYVGVYLYPQGTQGFGYSFVANPHGARYQTSTENSAYQPDWAAAGQQTPAGYVVTMRIPFGIIRSGGSKTWRAQFVRSTVATGGLAVWNYAELAGGAQQALFAGILQGVASGSASRPKPRAQLYGLGEATTRANGGSTTHVGADLSLPVTPTASLVATLHPDFSNVEIDQQTIAPTAFARQFVEVRPFFTQVAQPFNAPNFGCSNCPLTLYTPAIPSFGDGYALEGTQGPLTFGAFDTLGTNRTDEAQTLEYRVSELNRAYGADVQRVAVDTGAGLHDDTTSFATFYNNRPSHVYVYANGAQQSGTDVTNPSSATYSELGFGYGTSTTSLSVAYQHLGAEFAPADGFIMQNDTAGVETMFSQTVNFAPSAPLHDITLNANYWHLHNHLAQADQTTGSEQINFDFSNLLSLHLYGASEGVQAFGSELLPFNGNGAFLGYRSNTTTPTYLSYSGGAYFHGHLDAWTYLSTLPLTRRARLTLETDEDRYGTVFPGETTGTQWLERASTDWQISRQASFDLGVRRIFGQPLPNSLGPPSFAKIKQANLSAAFHLLSAHNEFYVVYGDPNSLNTTPALFVKWIRYIGAGKGT